MNRVRKIFQAFSPARHRGTIAAVATSFAFACASPSFAQQQTTAPMLFASSTLPDAPGTVLARATEPNDDATESTSLTGISSAAADPQLRGRPAIRPVSPHDKIIYPGEVAPELTVRNKVLIGLRETINPFNALGWALSAGYQQAVDGSPNYGTNSTAFGKRFGAAAARGSSESIFSDSIMASVLHEDTRYYRLGPGTNVVKRIAYAATRPLVGRTDGGRTTPNFALLTGNLGASYLTKTYYPELNQSNDEVLKTFGGSLGGAAISDLLSEFFGDGFFIFKRH